MTKDIINSEPFNEIEALAFELLMLNYDMGMKRHVAIANRPMRGGGWQIAISGNREILVNDSTGLLDIRNGQISRFIDLIGKSLVSSGKDMSSVELLCNPIFAMSCLSEIDTLPSLANTFLSDSAIPETIPCFYGSTSGFNFAELLETGVCARTLKERGQPSSVLFETIGGETLEANQILFESVRIIPDDEADSFLGFLNSLGSSISERSVNAALSLLEGDIPIQIVNGESVLEKLGNTFTMGKLLVLAKLAGQNPKLFAEVTMQNVLDRIDSNDPSLLRAPVSNIDSPFGFTWYARDAVIAADFQGAFATPLKMTTHANIYKILKDYGSLYNPLTESGTILCPITKHRIQTRAQAYRNSGDPCDVTVLAFLATTQPENFARLMFDFNASCKVLTPREAIEKGTVDKKLIVEDYFEL